MGSSQRSHAIAVTSPRTHAAEAAAQAAAESRRAKQAAQAAEQAAAAPPRAALRAAALLVEDVGPREDLYQITTTLAMTRDRSLSLRCCCLHLLEDGGDASVCGCVWARPLLFLDCAHPALAHGVDDQPTQAPQNAPPRPLAATPRRRRSPRSSHVARALAGLDGASWSLARGRRGRACGATRRRLRARGGVEGGGRGLGAAGGVRGHPAHARLRIDPAVQLRLRRRPRHRVARRQPRADLRAHEAGFALRARLCGAPLRAQPRGAVILNTPATHAEAPPHDGPARGTLSGLHPRRAHRRRRGCRYTYTGSMDPAGVAPDRRRQLVRRAGGPPR